MHEVAAKSLLTFRIIEQKPRQTSIIRLDNYESSQFAHILLLNGMLNYDCVPNFYQRVNRRKNRQNTKQNTPKLFVITKRISGFMLLPYLNFR